MEFFQFAGEGVNLRGREFGCRSRREEALINFRFSSQSLVTGLRSDATPRQASSPTFHQPPHNVQHVERPAALGDGNLFNGQPRKLSGFDATELFAGFGREPNVPISRTDPFSVFVFGNFFQRFDAPELFPDFLRRNDDCSSRRESALTFPALSRRSWSGLTSAATSDDNRNASFGRHPVQGDIATDPPCPARGRRQRLSAFTSGFSATSRLMTADSENMNDGIRSRSRTSQVARA